MNWDDSFVQPLLDEILRKLKNTFWVQINPVSACALDFRR